MQCRAVKSFGRRSSDSDDGTAAVLLVMQETLQQSTLQSSFAVSHPAWCCSSKGALKCMVAVDVAGADALVAFLTVDNSCSIPEQ